MHADFFSIESDRHDRLKLPVIPHNFQWSRNLYGTTRGEWIAVFRPLNLGLAFFKRKILDNNLSAFIFNPKSELLSVLSTEHFLFPKTNNIDEIERRFLIEKARQGPFRFICILPTTKCPLFCDYCHQRTLNPSSMTPAEIEEGLQKSAELCENTNNIDLLIYGGEPMAEFPLVEKILEMLNGRRNVLRKPVNITLATSGIGLSQDKARLLGKNRVFVIVSVDGTKEFNDPVRRMKDGSSSFRVAKNAIMRLKSAGCRFGLSITVSKQNIEHFPQILDTLLSEFSPQDIGLNAFLHRIDNDLNPHQIDSAQAFSAFLEGFRIALKYGIYAEQPLRRFKPFIQRRPLVKDCSAPGERLVLAPGGLMGFCDSAYPERKYFYPYQQFPERTHLDYVKWSGLSSVEMPHCQVCPAMTVCGGACRYDAYKASGKLDGIDKMRCSFELSFLSWLIWRLFDTLKLQDKLFYFPTDSERRSLLENLADLVKNQPFTAGSLIDWN